jgi:cytochrome c553
MKSALYILATVVVSLFVSVTSFAQGQPLTQPIQEKEKAALFPSTAMIDQGKKVAEINCADCHGMNGISDSQGQPHLAGQRAVYLYRAQQAYHLGARDDETKKHNGFLNDDALLAVSAYYSSLTPAVKSETQEPSQQADTPEEDPFLGIRGAMKRCIKCHDETGNAEGSGMPNLTAQDPEYFVTSMMGYVDRSRSHTLMRKLVGKLDEATIKEMGLYYAVQEPLRTQTQGEGDVNVGARLAENCKSCHGDDGNTKKAKMPTLAGQDAKYFIKAMNHYKDGKRLNQKMFEAVEQFSEQDMIDLATYYAAQEPVKRNVRAPLKSAEWIKRCVRCHGTDGNSSDPRFPMLAGQDENYLKMSLKAYAREERNNTTMHAMADPLSPMDIELIAAYFASQQAKAVVYIQLPCTDGDTGQSIW